MQALNTDKKVALWLLLWSSVLLAPLAARADVVTDWNMTAIESLPGLRPTQPYVRPQHGHGPCRHLRCDQRD